MREIYFHTKFEVPDDLSEDDFKRLDSMAHTVFHSIDCLLTEEVRNRIGQSATRIDIIDAEED